MRNLARRTTLTLPEARATLTRLAVVGTLYVEPRTPGTRLSLHLNGKMPGISQDLPASVADKDGLWDLLRLEAVSQEESTTYAILRHIWQLCCDHE